MIYLITMAKAEPTLSSDMCLIAVALDAQVVSDYHCALAQCVTDRNPYADVNPVRYVYSCDHATVVKVDDAFMRHTADARLVGSVGSARLLDCEDLSPIGVDTRLAEYNVSDTGDVWWTCHMSADPVRFISDRLSLADFRSALRAAHPLRHETPVEAYDPPVTPPEDPTDP